VRATKTAPDPAQEDKMLLDVDYAEHPQTCGWLDIAEVELSVFTRQCLNRRIPDLGTLPPAPFNSSANRCSYPRRYRPGNGAL